MDLPNQTTDLSPPLLLTRLPNDTLELIILYLSSSDLKACCLSNETLRYFARPRIFTSILLEDVFDVEELEVQPFTGDKRCRVSDFCELLDGSPDIGSLVRSLTVLYTSHPDPSKHTFNVSGWTQDFESVMAKMTNLVSFSFGRLGIRWVSHLNWEKDVPPNIGCVLRRVLTLPSLRNFGFHDSFGFRTTQNFFDLLSLDGPCFVDSLELVGQGFDDVDDIPSNASPYRANIARLGLSYVNATVQQRIIGSLFSSASPFNVRNLTCVAFTHNNSNDSPWISYLLDGQETSYRLQRLELLDPEYDPGGSLGIFKSLQRFHNIRTIVTSFDEDADEVGTYEVNVVLWIRELPENVLSQVEKVIIIWIPGSGFNHDSPRPTLPAFDSLFTSGAMPKLTSVMLRVQSIVGFFDIDATEFFMEELKGRWYEIAADLLPKACNAGIVSVDSSLVER